MNPPDWLDAVLRLLLPPEHRDSVSGDLLEEYREVIRPQRGEWRADVWYATQVAGFLARSATVWGALLALAGTIRLFIDAFVPVANYAERAQVSTWSHVAICLAAGFWGGWRSARIRGGALVALTAGLVNAVACIAMTFAFILVFHDRSTQDAIAQAGGIEESFVMPIVIVPVIVAIGTIGAMFGKALAVVARHRRHRA